MTADQPEPREPTILHRVAQPGQELREQLGRTRQVLTGSADEAGERALAEYGANSRVDARILSQLANNVPLADPERFLPAHQQVAQALEVYDREGSANPSVPNLWLLKPLAEYLVEGVADYVKRSYLKQAADATRRLYLRREVQCPRDLPERSMLARARIEMDRIAAGFNRSSSTVLGLIAGGAALSAFASLGRGVGALYLENPYVLFIVVGLTFAIASAIAGVLLRGAATARHRARLTLLPALQELWTSIGNCGNPPEDDADVIATTAVVVTAIGWLLLPATALLVSLS